MVWTRFMDMHSGGSLKESVQYIYIEAPEEEAKLIFFNRFGHSPERVTCTCCGEDYSVSEEEGDLAQVSAYERGCRFGYFDPDGNEVPRSKAFKPGKGYVKGCYSKYVEDKAEGDYRKYLTLEEWLASGEAHVIYKEGISKADLRGELPRQGYVWVD